MTKHDVREYLEKIYELPVREVHLQAVQGHIYKSTPDPWMGVAMEKEPDEMFAYVVLVGVCGHDRARTCSHVQRRDTQFTFPDIFKSEQARERHRKIEINLAQWQAEEAKVERKQDGARTAHHTNSWFSY
jgi:hypothetical protein